MLLLGLVSADKELGNVEAVGLEPPSVLLSNFERVDYRAEILRKVISRTELLDENVEGLIY